MDADATDQLDEIDRLDPRQRIYRNDATLWVWIFYGLAQATITMLMAFDVIETLTAAEVCTAVTLIVYVAVNELIVRPSRGRRRHRATATAPETDSDEIPEGPLVRAPDYPTDG